MKAENIRRKVSMLVAKLQKQTNVPLWALADENVIYALATNVKPLFGPRGKSVLFLMKLLRPFGMRDGLLFFVGLYKVFFIWFKVWYKTMGKKTPNIPRRIFAGFGAASEEWLYAEYAKKTDDSHLRINVVTYDGLCEVGCPSLFCVIVELFKLSNGHTRKLRNETQEIATNLNECLTIAASNIGVYAFYRNFWRMAKLRGVAEVEFLALGVYAFACVDEHIYTIYTQHGLMALSILIPSVNHFNVITRFDEFYLKKIFPCARIANIDKQHENVGQKTDTVMILSPNISIEKRILEMAPFIKWVREMKLQIIFRPTQAVTPVELSLLKKQYVTAIIDDYCKSLYQSIEKWRPMFVVAWSSTGLVTALNYGVLPINLHEPTEIYEQGSYNTDINTVYPVAKRVLFWPRDVLLIERAAQSKEEYDIQIENLKNYQDHSLV